MVFYFTLTTSYLLEYLPFHELFLLKYRLSYATIEM